MISTQPIDFGPLNQLFKSEDINEIMINSWNKIFVEHKGILVQTNLSFPSETVYNSLIQNILNSNSQTGSQNQLSFDGTLNSGFRYNITLPPLTPLGATLTVRKFSNKIFTFEDLIKKNSLSEKAAAFLKSAVQSRLTLVVSGGTGTGKTSFLNTLSLEIPYDQRVVSIEDTQELRSQHPNWVYMLTHKEKDLKYSARDCLVNSLRMRPDRIIIGECRGAEAYDFLSAINTGHEGSMTSLHANSAPDALSRLENLVTLGHSEIPLKYLRTQISNGIDLIVQLKRNANGQRQITDILELTGMEGDIITRASIFGLNSHGELDVTGYVPYCLKKITDSGIEISAHFFDPKYKLAKVI